MSIVWKPIKYKHRLEAQEIGAGIVDKTISERELVEFVTGLVEDWDFIDVETGEPVAVGDYGELTEDQFVELMAAFQEKMEANKGEAVKKNRAGLTSLRNASSSSNGSRTSAKAKQPASRRPRPGG